MFEKIKTLALQGHTKSQFRFVYDSVLELKFLCVSYNDQCTKSNFAAEACVLTLILSSKLAGVNKIWCC